MIYFLAPKGRCGIENYVAGCWRTSNDPEIQCVAYEDVFMQRTLPCGTWVFMGVQQLPPAGRMLAERVWQALADAGQKVLNRPKLLPSRHSLLDVMYRAGINEFRSHLPGEINDDIRYPVFVRKAEQHTGSMSGLIRSRRELETFLRWQQLRGYKSHEMLVIEFCDTVNATGEYRKYSAQYVQGDVAARHLHVDTHWMVKAHGSTFHDEWAYEERDFIRQNSHAAEIKKIFELVKFDYGRIDYGFLNGKIQVWEINSNPTIGRARQRRKIAETLRRTQQLQEPGKTMFFERFHSMLEAIDSPEEPGVVVDLGLSATELQSWHKEVNTTVRLQRRRIILGQLSAWAPIKLARDIAKSMLGVETPNADGRKRTL